MFGNTHISDSKVPGCLGDFWATFPGGFFSQAAFLSGKSRSTLRCQRFQRYRPGRPKGPYTVGRWAPRCKQFGRNPNPGISCGKKTAKETQGKETKNTGGGS